MSNTQVKQHFFNSSLDGSERVDSELGTIHGVSVITSGVQARGHNLEVDNKTLDQIKACALSMKSVPVKVDHRSGAGAICGYLTNFHLADGKLKADWNLLKSHERYSHIMEMAERMPSNVGLSAAFMGKEEKKAGKAYARCTELVAVDLVATPAANPDGLFEAKVDALENGMSAPADKTELSTEDKILASLQNFETRFAALEEFQKQLVEFAESDEDEDDSEDVTDDEGEDADEPGDEAGEEFGSPLEAALVYLEQKVNRQAAAEKDAELEFAFETVNEKVAGLIELNEQLAAQNEALQLALKEGNSRQISSGHETKVRLFSNDGNQDEFEARVTELEAGGKKKTEAIMLAMKEDKGRYERHMERIGALAK